MNLKKSFGKKILLLLLVAFAITLTGCSGSRAIDTSSMYSVIYDGNGGYLGNKSSTYRKLQVAENSKIPKYLQVYAQDQYVVSSLGLATRVGYTLLGWYLEENAEYGSNPLGAYVYLDLASGNGVYNMNDEGDYVYGYVENANGSLIHIYVQPIPEETADPDTVDYIYYNGTNGYGFYIYNSEEPDQVTIYERDGSYLYPEISKYATTVYLLYEDLSVNEKAFFVDLPRYNQAYYEYTEADLGLQRYSLESGYIYFDTLMVADNFGMYAFDGNSYVVYDSENVDHADLDRFSVNSRYVFTPSVDIQTPSDLARFNASITYWDFETQRVTKNMTLHAHWVKKLTVQYVQKSGQVTSITTKMNPENTDPIDLVVGDTLGIPATVPTYPGYTFVGWSTSETEYLPWDFANDVFPANTELLTLYGYMIEGTYTRIISAAGLEKVVENPAGNYLLCADIDLAGAVFSNKAPTGFELKTAVTTVHVPFTGTFISMGYSISNFTLSASNSQKSINEDAGVVIILALFPYVQNATIDGVIIKNAEAVIVTTPVSTGIICDLGVSGIVGTALEGNTIISNCSVEMTFSPSDSARLVTHNVYVGDIIARGTEFATLTNCESTIDYSLLAGITTATLIVETLN